MYCRPFLLRSQLHLTGLVRQGCSQAHLQGYRASAPPSCQACPVLFFPEDASPRRVGSSRWWPLLASGSSRALYAELRDFMANPLSNVSAAPQGEDLFRWSATIIGPEGSPYAGGVFFLDIQYAKRRLGCHRVPFLPDCCLRVQDAARLPLQATQVHLCHQGVPPQHLCEWRNLPRHSQGCLVASPHAVARTLIYLVAFDRSQPRGMCGGGGGSEWEQVPLRVVQDPLVPEIAALYKSNRAQFEQNARNWTAKMATQ